MFCCSVSISFSLFIIGIAPVLLFSHKCLFLCNFSLLFLSKRTESLYLVFLDRICEELFWHLDQIPFSGDRRNQRIFYRMKSGWVKPGDCFLVDQPMGSDTFDQITAR